MMNKPNQRSYRPTAWFFLLTFFSGYVIYMVSYTGNDWYVVPVEPFTYPPDNQSAPIKMGLFWMCVQTHCQYDLKVDYMIVKYLPFKDIQQAFQNYRTICAGLITAGMILLTLALGAYLLFLSGFKFSHYVGFVTGGLQVLGSIVSVIGIAIYGAQFRGSTYYNPFGWSLWLMVASVIWLTANGLTVIVLTITIIAKTKKGASEFNAPLSVSI